MMVRVNLVLLAVLIACALSLVTSRHQARKLFIDLEREVAQTRAYDVEYGQLQIEQSTWAMPARVEKVAREQLRMQLPTPDRIETTVVHRTDQTFGVQHYVEVRALVANAPPLPKRQVQAQRRMPRR